METCLKKVELDTTAGKREAFAIEIGNGTIGMAAVRSGEHRAILMRDRKTAATPGAVVRVDSASINDGDVLIFCKSRAAALALLETSARLLAMFALEEEDHDHQPD